MTGPPQLAWGADESIDFTNLPSGPLSQFVGVDSIASFSLGGLGPGGVPYNGSGYGLYNSPTSNYPTNNILQVSFNVPVTNVFFSYEPWGINSHPDQGWSAFDSMNILLGSGSFTENLTSYDLSNLGEIGRLEFNNGENDWIMYLATLSWSTGPSNQEALNSANTTGVFMGNANASATNHIINTITGGLHNGRIVRARSHLSNPRLIDTQSWVTADRSLPNYLNFAANQGITMRQALGLEDIPASSSVAVGSAPLMMGLSIGYSKEPLNPKVPLEAPKRWEVYAVGDIGDVEQDALDVVNRGYRSRIYAGSVGAEYFVSDRLNIGTAFSYADSETDFAENLGSADIEGRLGSVYATYFKDGAYVDALYSYGAFDHNLIRNTGGGNAFGNTDSNAHTFSVNAGKNFAYNGLVTGPTLGLDHTTGTVDAYTETGALPLNFADRDFESTISSLGWQVSRTKKVNSGLFTLQGSASWDHEYQPEGGVTRGTLVADPNVPFNGAGVGPGTDWLNLGLGLRLLTNGGVDFEIDYQTQLFREDVTAHYGGFKISTRF